MDRLDVGAERIALMLGPDSVLAIARYVGKPAAAWTGDHAANFYRTSFGTNRTRAPVSRMAASNIRCTPQMVRGESDSWYMTSVAAARMRLQGFGGAARRSEF